MSSNIQNFGKYHSDNQFSHHKIDGAPNETDVCDILAVSHLLNQDYYSSKKIFTEHKNQFYGNNTTQEIYSFEFGMRWFILENDFNKIPNNAIVSVIDAAATKHVVYYLNTEGGHSKYPSTHCFLKRDGKRWDTKNEHCYVIGYYSKDHKKNANCLDFSVEKFKESSEMYGKLCCSLVAKNGYKDYDEADDMLLCTISGSTNSNEGR